MVVCAGGLGAGLGAGFGTGCFPLSSFVGCTSVGPVSGAAVVSLFDELPS